MFHESPINLDAIEPRAAAERTADLCLKCNICTSACPTAAVTELFPGPKTVGPQAQRFRHPGARGQASPDKSVDYCSGCGICTMVCPHGVKVMEMNSKARAALYDGERAIFNRLPLRNRILGRSELLGKIGRPVAPLANFVFELPITRLLAEKIMGMHRKGPFPAWQSETFRQWFGRRMRPDVKAARGTVAYFHGCAGNYYEPWVPRAALAVLERNGYTVTLPRQNCCGLPMMSNGEYHAARGYARRNLRWLAPYARAGTPIVGHGTSCTLSLKSDYREILDIHTEEARLVARHTYDLCEFLVERLDAGELDTDFQRVEARVIYHAQCQLKAHNMGLPALDLFELIPGLEVVMSEAECCGIAGTYGYKREKYNIAQAVGAPLFEQVKRVKPDVVVCDSETCRWWIESTTGVRTIHPVELIAAAYGMMWLGGKMV
ncbi:MAG: anaerobic glycerol-3-phosphate dehydrogenase subunit C [Anaerolineae bacterium]|nr:anaerobic glycerol-3-phosphate dehydrogenase subunit C [Anaerolineae bacterium]